MKSTLLKPALLSLAMLVPALSFAAEPNASSQSATTSVTAQPPPPGGKGGPGRNPAVEEALRACRTSLASGQGSSAADPGRMEACMTAKGFKRPPGSPPRGHGGQGGQPPPEGGPTSE